MTRRVSITHTYPVPASRLWSCCVSYRCLAEMMARLVTYDGLPTGELHVGQSFDLQVTHFKVTPPLIWHIDVIRRDNDRRILRTSERGGSINTYHHTMTVDEIDETHSSLVDEIEFDAGWLSLPMTLWVKHIYKSRDIPRRRLLGLT